MKVLEVRNLKKNFGKREIVKDISFDVNEGEVFGFLGPNGAGKTTTIKMLVGLIGNNGGTIKIFGKDLKSDKEGALKNVGAVVENPELYGYLTGRENLNQFAAIRNISKHEVLDIIKLIGLEERIDDKVKKYSLGMKQRLGLGVALLGNPKLLILDEPTNGLDPSGILDLREVVRNAAKERGMAVFVSSHILNEVQHLCDRVAFVNHGVIQAVEKVVDDSLETDTHTFIFDCKDPAKATEVFNTIDNLDVLTAEDTKITVKLKGIKSSYVVNSLVKNNIEIDEVYRKYCGLEQRYMELVEGGIR